MSNNSFALGCTAVISSLLVAGCGETGLIVDARPDAVVFAAPDGAIDAEVAPALWQPQNADDFSTVQYVGDKAVVLLGELADAAEHTHGRVRAIEQRDSLVVTGREVDAATIDAEARAWLQAGADLYAADGTLCHAAVTKISAVGLLNIGDDDVSGLRNTTLRWQRSVSRNAVYVVAELSAAGCPNGAVWARQGAPVPAVAWRSEPATPALTALALAAVPALPLAQQAMKDFQEYQPHDGKTWDSDASTDVALFTVGAHRYVRMTLIVDGGCGSWGTNVEAVWEVLSRNGLDVLELREQSSDTSDVVFATDMNHDGVPEFVAPDTFDAPWSSDDFEGCGC